VDQAHQVVLQEQLVPLVQTVHQDCQVLQQQLVHQVLQVQMVNLL
jgi:hypothetical protein